MSQRSQSSVKGQLYYLIGLPCSGKSTYANNWVRSAHRMDWVGNPTVGGRFVLFPRVIVSGDDFRHALHGKEYLPEAEGSVFAMMDVATRALLRRGFDVLIDETSTTDETITRYLRLDINARPIWIDTPVEECLARALALNRPYLEKPILRMHEQKERLKKDFDGILARLKSYVQFRTSHDVSI